MAKKIICKQCKKEIKVAEGYKYKGDKICAQCKSDAIPYSIPDYDSGSVESGSQGSSITKCAGCKKLFENTATGDAFTYKGKNYCKTCYENKIRQETPLSKCSKCGSQYQNYGVTFVNDYHGKDPSIYKGKKLCPKCYAIAQHDDTIAGSNAYRAKLIADKARATKRQLIKPSPKSHFQGLAEDHRRIVRLLKEQNR